MKLIFSFLSLLFLISFISDKALAQEDSLISQIPRGIFHNGSWAIQFEESKYSRLIGTNDFAIIGKKYMSSSTAIRAGVSILGLFDNSYDNTYFKSNGTMDYSFNNVGTKLNGTQIFLQYIFYPVNRKALNLYLGGGPTFMTFTKNINQFGYDVQNNLNDYYVLTGKDKGWGIGALFTIGAEWIPYRNFGITAEYSAFMVMSQHSVDSYTQYSTTPIASYTNVRSTMNLETVLSDVIVGVQVYL